MGRTPTPGQTAELTDRRAVLDELRTLAGRLIAVIEILEADLERGHDE